MKTKSVLFTVAALFVSLNAKANHACALIEEKIKGSNQFNQLVDQIDSIDLSGPKSSLVFSRPEFSVFGSTSVDGTFTLISAAGTQLRAMASGNGDHLSLLEKDSSSIIYCVKK
jgi:hypothetical protein